MLHVTYKAVDDLEPGRLATIDEDRGELLIRLDATQPLADVIRQLNVEWDQFLSRADWFQLWGKEILSRHTPDRPLRVRFILVPGFSQCIAIGEDRGIAPVYVGAGMTTAEFAASMNPAVRDFLARGRWFQLYAGEIIDHSPEPMSRV